MPNRRWCRNDHRQRQEPHSVGARRRPHRSFTRTSHHISCLGVVSISCRPGNGARTRPRGAKSGTPGGRFGQLTYPLSTLCPVWSLTHTVVISPTWTAHDNGTSTVPARPVVR
jgi:hypothetical protein